MAIPSGQQLLQLDFVFQGQPFVHVVSKGGTSSTLDFSYKGTPFVGFSNADEFIDSATSVDSITDIGTLSANVDDVILSEDSFSFIGSFVETLSETIVTTEAIVLTQIILFDDLIDSADSIAQSDTYYISFDDIINYDDSGGGDFSQYQDIFSEDIVYVDSIENDTFVGNPDIMVWSKYLPSKFLQVPMISDMMNTFWLVIGKEVRDALVRLRDIRNPEICEIEFAERITSTLGFNQNLDNLNNEDKRRLLSSLVNFYKRQGTKFTFDFLSFLSQEKFTVIPLYTNDYVNFSSVPQGTLEPQGDWYLTQHVDIDIQTDELDTEDFTKRFYEIAPATLVIRFINKAQTSQGNLYERGFVHTEFVYNASTNLITVS